MTVMSKKYFLISISDHFEDWYVADDLDNTEYGNLNGAVAALKYNFEVIMTDKDPMVVIYNEH